MCWSNFFKLTFLYIMNDFFPLLLKQKSVIILFFSLQLRYIYTLHMDDVCFNIFLMINLHVHVCCIYVE